MKKQNIIFLFLLLAAGLLNAQAPFSLSWAESFGGSGSEATSDIINAGNYVVTTGSFSGNVDFDPASGVNSHTSVGNTDIYISCFDKNGNLIWVNTFGSTNGDAGKALYSDGTYLYATGYFYLTMDCDPGPGTVNLTSVGGADVYMCKFDLATGALMWAKNVGGTSDDLGYAISGDNQTVYIGGTFQLTADFDPGTGTSSLTSAGSTDNFVLALDLSGAYQWANRFGNTGGETASGVSADGAGGVCIVGAFSGTVDFNPGAGTYNLNSNAGSLDFYVLKLTNSGGFSWAVNIGGTGSDNVLDMTIEQSTGNIFLGGYFQLTCDFDPNAGTSSVTSNGSNDIFGLTLNSNGVFVNMFRIGGTGSDIARGITIDQNNIYLCGGFAGTVDFDPGSGTQNLTGPGGFVLATDHSGNYVWAGMMGEVTTQFYSIAADNIGGVYTTAPFQNAPDFDPGSGTYTLTSNGLNDAAVVKLNSCPVVTPSNSGQSNVSCLGGNNGSATVSASGGTSFTYNWAPTGGSAATASGLSAGTYTCTVTNQCLNSNTISFTITEPTALSLTSASQTNVSCNAGNNGAAAVNAATGGAGGYTYNWTPGNPTGNGTISVTGLTSDSWTCTVTDANSCSTTQTFIITQPSALTANSLANSILCNGGSSTVTVSGNGGTTPYTGEGSFTETAGTYTYTVSDANGCSTTTTVNISEPTALTASSLASSILCNGGSSTVTVSGNGGTTPYTGEGSFTETAGTYTYTVSDANGCSTTTTVNISEPTALTASSLASSILCNGGSSTVTVSGNGGTTPYTGEGSFTETAGTYTYTVSDANGCSSTTTVNISEPTALTASSLASTILCNGGSSTVTVSGNGGTTPYTGEGSFTETAGTYTYTVSDANGCSSTTTVNISEPTAIIETITANGEILIADQNGASYQWIDCDNGNSPISGETNQTFTAITNGNYAVEVTVNSCSVQSACENVSSIGISKFTPISSVNIYPNPSEGQFVIELQQNANIIVTDATGRIISSDYCKIGKNKINLNYLQIGVYFISIRQNNNVIQNSKIVIDR